MQREREGRNYLYGIDNPFGNFSGFSMMPSLFGGKDPFDDPFFTRPFGLESSRFQPQSSADCGESCDGRGKAIAIEEVTSDAEEENGVHAGNMKNSHNEHDGSSKEPLVEHPDDDSDAERTSKVVNHGSKYNRRAQTEPQTRSFSSQTSKVTYGGVDGAYYTTTRTRRTGTDGVLIEESKEADKTTGQATHRISRGIHDKGHSVTRKLNAEGKVDTMQTLHNLDEDELTGFEAAWNGNVKENLHDWIDPFGSHGSTGSSRSEQKGMVNWGRWGRPSAGNARNVGADRSDTGASAGRAKKVVRINIE